MFVNDCLHRSVFAKFYRTNIGDRVDSNKYLFSARCRSHVSLTMDFVEGYNLLLIFIVFMHVYRLVMISQVFLRVDYVKNNGVERSSAFNIFHYIRHFKLIISTKINLNF